MYSEHYIRKHKKKCDLKFIGETLTQLEINNEQNSNDNEYNENTIFDMEKYKTKMTDIIINKFNIK